MSIERRVSEDPEWLRSAAFAAADAFGLDETCGLAVIGSISEGFGNATSDVDVLLVPAREANRPVVRHMSAYEGRRVEVFVRSAEALRQFGRRLPVESTVDDEDLDFYHRVGRCHVVADTPQFRAARCAFDMEWLVSRSWRMASDRCRQMYERAVAAAAIHRGLDAVVHGRKALEYAAIAFASARGETYNSTKFLDLRLQRAGLDSQGWAKYQALRTHTDDSRCETFLSELASLFAEWGIAQADPQWRASLLEDTQLVQVGEHLVASRRGRSAILDDPDGSLHAALQQPLPLSDAPFASELGFLHRAGIVGVSNLNQQWVDTRYHPPVGTLHIHSQGLELSDARVLVGHDAEAIVSAGLSLLRSAFVIENRAEDAIGAIERKDYRTARNCFEAILIHYATVALCHDVLTPRPQGHECLEVLRLDPARKALAAVLERGLGKSVRSAADLRSYYDLIDEVRALVPPKAISRHFRGCHHSAIKWAKLVTYVFPVWARAAQQAGVRGKDDGFAHLMEYGRTEDSEILGDDTLLQWRRDTSLREAVAQLEL